MDEQTIGVIEQLWQWAEGLPAWQSDLLRRLTEVDALDEPAREEVLQLLLAAHDALPPGVVAPPPRRVARERAPAPGRAARGAASPARAPGRDRPRQPGARAAYRAGRRAHRHLRPERRRQVELRQAAQEGLPGADRRTRARERLRAAGRAGDGLHDQPKHFRDTLPTAAELGAMVDELDLFPGLCEAARREVATDPPAAPT